MEETDANAHKALRPKANEEFMASVSNLQSIANVPMLGVRAVAENEFKNNPILICSGQLAAHGAFICILPTFRAIQ